MVEDKTYPYECTYALTHNSARLLSTHLLYIENIPNMKISFVLNAIVGRANYSKKTLKYHKSLFATVLIVCHEVGHLIDRRDNGYGGKRPHTKRHKKIVKRLIMYCRKNDYLDLVNVRTV